MSVIRAATVHNHNRSRRTSSSESPTGGADQEDHDSSQVFEQRGTDVNGIDSERDPGDQGESGDPTQATDTAIAVQGDENEESILLPEAEFTLNAIAEAELNKYMKKKTRTMIWFAICIMAGNAAHLRTIKGVNDVANNLSSGPVKATKTEFGDMLVAMPTLIVMGLVAVLFMLMAIFLLGNTYLEVIKNNRDTKKWQKINGYVEVLVVLTFILNMLITFLAGPEDWFRWVWAPDES